MKALRLTMHHPEGIPPITIVVGDDALKVPMERVVEEMMDAAPEIFVTYEIFETEIQDEVELSIEALTRAESTNAEEANAAILFYYTAQMFDLSAPGGVIASRAVAPFSADLVRFVFERLVKHPKYRGQTLACSSNDNEAITLSRRLDD